MPTWLLTEMHFSGLVLSGQLGNNNQMLFLQVLEF